MWIPLPCVAKLTQTSSAPLHQRLATTSGCFYPDIHNTHAHSCDPTPPNMEDPPSKHQIQECFMLFDKNGEGRIPRSELAMCLRSLRCKPTNREADEIATSVLGSKSQFGSSELETCVSRAFSLPCKTEEDFNEALKVFDRDSSGTLHVPELRHVLGNLGEKLGDHEMKEFLHYCDSDMLAIDDFTAKLFSSGNM